MTKPIGEKIADIESLARRFNTVGAFWHDAYAEWQVVVDWQRRTFEDCRYVGWGDTLSEAIAQIKKQFPDVEWEG